MLRTALLTLFILPIGCAHQATQYNTTQVQTVPAYLSAVSTEFKFYDSVDEVAEACKIITPNFIVYGCAKGPELVNGQYWCTIHTLKPKDFADEVRVKILGHEVMHCLGARHN